MALRTIHTMLFEPTFRLSKECEFEFIGADPPLLAGMNLDTHYLNQHSGFCELLKDRQKNLALDILFLLRERRRNLKLESLVGEKKLMGDIEEQLKTKKAQMTSKTKTQQQLIA